MDTLPLLKDAMAAMGAVRLYFKELAANDNSKNQFYMGPNLDALNVLPVGDVVAAVGSTGKPILKAPVRLSWLSPDGAPCPAADAQVIYYPQYPEARLSSLIRGCPAAPSALLASRQPGRILVLGVTREASVIAFLAVPGSSLAAEIAAGPVRSIHGVLSEMPLMPDDRAQLLSALRAVADRGWVSAVRMLGDGSTVRCAGPNCGGLTLEALLGVRPNSVAGPDYAGWEVKQHSVTNLERPRSGTLTLMTPEPDGGVYRTQGVEAFIRRYGYVDTLGRSDRLNFGGRHVVGAANTRTGLSLRLVGFDLERCAITDALGGLELVGDDGDVAARWSFAKLINHWRTKHAKCVYVPSVHRATDVVEYRYGHRVELGQGTSFELLAVALSDGVVFYDPGLKLENASSSHPKHKRRNQIRVGFRGLAELYEVFESVDTRGA
jgi:hypothetical protein